MKRGILKVLASKTFIIIILALLQIAFLFGLIFFFTTSGVLAYAIISIITVLVLVAVLEQDNMNPAYKLAWIMLILVMPVFGVVFYLLWGNNAMPRPTRRKLLYADRRVDGYMKQDPEVLDTLEEIDPHLFQCAYYLLHESASPVYPTGETEHYPLGKDFFAPYLDALRSAEKYIFMEYYIWSEGSMLDEIKVILKEKAAQGVDVRLLWDGFGSLVTLPDSFRKEMEESGVKCRAFTPISFTPHITQYAMLNHRDHRKITVIDGNIGFSGGLNIADEYINRKIRFGEWKDTSFKITGAAVHSLSAIFLRGWDYASGEDSNLEEFIPAPKAPEKDKLTLENGFCQPYWDSPLDTENVCENTYMNVLRHAVDYVYISTPYLILDNEMITNLSLAAKSGVDVRILTPGIPDKKRVFSVTQSYYPVLLRAGVRIYEYTPGFNHAKMFVSDDKIAINGSANLDYRSLYLHFENCVAFYGGQMVQDIKADMEHSFTISQEITLESLGKPSVRKRIGHVVGRFFAPLL